MEMVRTVVFTGPLAEKFGEKFEFAANSIAEVTRALCVMVPGFEKFMMESKDNDMAFAVLVDDQDYGEEELHNPLGSSKEVHFIPVIGGAKKGGILQIIVGAVLIAAAFAAVFFLGPGAIPFAKAMIGMGVSMIVGGVVQMLSPQPKLGKNDRKDDPSSAVFNGTVNVQAQGASVPLAYGEIFAGSVVISAGINASDNYVIPGRPPTSSDGEYRGGGSMMGDVIARAIDEAE